MSRKRKPAIRPMAAATEELFWKAKFHLQILEVYRRGQCQPGDLRESAQKLNYALEDFEASRDAVVVPEPQLELRA